MQKEEKFIQKIKSQFILGLVVILPLALTLYIIWVLFSSIDSILGKYLSHLTGAYIYGLGFLLLIFIIWFVGFVSHSPFGQAVVRHVRLLIFKTPIFGNVFKGVDTISSKVLSKGKGSFKTVVILEYPKKDSYAIGFLTSGESIEFRNKKSAELVPVFIPTTPNPTSGFLVFVEKKNITRVKMSVEQAMETIISLGFIHPDKF